MLAKSFSGVTMMPVRKVLKKGYTHALSWLGARVIGKDMIFKVLRSVVYCILDNYVCVDYMCFPQTKIHITIKGQGFLKRTYNAVLGNGFPEIIMNIISCNLFLNSTKSDIILPCCRDWLIIIFNLFSL